MNGFLLFFVWAALWLARLGWQPEDEQAENAPVSGLQAALLLSAGLAIASEALSLGRWLLPQVVFTFWAFVFLAVTAIGFTTLSLKRGARRAVQGLHSLHGVEGLFWVLVAAILSVLFFVAVKTPPNTTDALLYHLARVAHWAQNASLAHYLTGYQHQLYNPIWAEEMILHLRLLVGDDRLAGLVQWTAFIGVLVAVQQIAQESGLGKKGQLLAVAFAASLPMGLLQAASTQNDMVVAFWLCCTALFTLRAARRILTPLEMLSLGLAVGLGLLTKGTFYVYAAPLGLWFLACLGKWLGLSLQRKAPQPGLAPEGRRAAGQAVGFISASAILLNLGYWARNLITYGGPLGSRDWVESSIAEVYGWGPFIASLIRNAAMNFATSDYYTNVLWSQILRVKLTPLDARMENFELIWSWNHEDLAGNPLHVILIGLAILILLISWRRVRDARLWAYLATVGGVYAMLALFIHFEKYGIRFQLPIFMVGAPIFGAAFDLKTWRPPEKLTRHCEERTLRRSNPLIVKDEIASQKPLAMTIGRIFGQSLSLGSRLTNFLTALLPFLLVMTAWPWVLMSQTRPIIALKDGGEPFSIPCHPDYLCTIGSILFEPPETLLFANHIDLRQDYLRMAEDIRQSGCQEIGLRIDSHHPEYLFWWILEAPQSGIRIESLYSYPELERYRDAAFRPCAVICTICGERTRLHGLPLFGRYANALLFLGPGFNPDPDQ